MWVEKKDLVRLLWVAWSSDRWTAPVRVEGGLIKQLHASVVGIDHLLHVPPVLEVVEDRDWVVVWIRRAQADRAAGEGPEEIDLHLKAWLQRHLRAVVFILRENRGEMVPASTTHIAVYNISARFRVRTSLVDGDWLVVLIAS
jgi:hypothetical protein